MATYRVGIVGAGVMGTHCLERLAAIANEGLFRRKQIQIFVFDRTGRFGDGSTYDASQAATNLVNRSASELALAADGTLSEALPLMPERERPNFVQWCRMRYQQTGERKYEIDGATAPRRALYGEALREMFEAWKVTLIQNGVDVILVDGEVVDVQIDRAARLEYVTSAGLLRRQNLDEVLLVTGHARRTTLDVRGVRGDYIPEPFPLSKSCARGVISSCSSVGLRGMGLAAIDVVLGLTEGRGGKFQLMRGRLEYMRSGDEPKRIVLTSQSGLFTYARPELPNHAPADKHSGWFLTKASIDALRRATFNAGGGTKLDFGKQVMPLVILEMAAVHYAVHLRRPLDCPASDDAEIFRIFRKHIDGDYVESSVLVQQLELDVGAANVPAEARFSEEQHLFPLRTFGYPRNCTWSEALLRFIDYDNEQASLGSGVSAFKAAGERVWRDLRSTFAYAADWGGLTPESHRDFVTRIYRLHNRLANGASVGVMRKIQALIQSGVLDVSAGPLAVWRKSTYGWSCHGNETGYEASVDVMIEATIQTFDDAHCSSRLYRNLLRRGTIRKWKNIEASDEFAPGAIEITKDFNAVNRDGDEVRRLSIMGAPTEGLVFFQPSAARPNCNYYVLNNAALWVKNLMNRLPVS
ncbi:FAD/NAD(P)-binding protein [Pandoraea sp. NPDC087047]|uniref:FAD/NAD(P)-binding protein n=1 Tax=Pandoraea sp. NPDC087047 TaxID=3364390 RepID=UPI003804A788